jgi:hypothetical protein
LDEIEIVYRFVTALVFSSSMNEIGANKIPIKDGGCALLLDLAFPLQQA